LGANRTLPQLPGGFSKAQLARELISANQEKSAFEKMIALLQQNAQPAAGTLNLPADGNPFPAMPGAKQGGLFAAGIAAQAGSSDTGNSRTLPIHG
jgi:hypothetical protein